VVTAGGRPWHDDLELARRLARAADSVTTAHFVPARVPPSPGATWRRAADVAADVESSASAILGEQAPGDGVVTTRLGETAGTTGRRWLILGIDDEINYSLGRIGWGTSVALDVDGTIELGLVSCPRIGHVAWAVRGRGAWITRHDAGGTAPGADAVRLRCGRGDDLDDLDRAVVAVDPWDGFLAGWRNEIARRFPLHPDLRSRGALDDAVSVASGRFDATILTSGGICTFAAVGLLVTEAGGTVRDGWGGVRLDTTTLICTNGRLVEPILDVFAGVRPSSPDVPRLAVLDAEPLGSEQERELDPWLGYGLRTLPPMSARVEVTNALPEIRNILDDRFPLLDDPFVGVTTDGVVRTDLRRLDDAPFVTTRPITDACHAFLEGLTSEERRRVQYPLDAAEWRTWLNVHMAHHRRGLLLEGLPPPSRQLALDVVRATTSARGYDQARTIMRINQLLAEISGEHDSFGEWAYFFTIFGEPGSDAPWGWQIDGHHLCLNALVLDGRVVMTPAFMGAEPRDINGGALAGTFLFGPEESTGLSLIRSLDERQRERTILHGSIHRDDISPLLQNRFDGRMQAGAYHDNAVLPYQGICGAELTDAQRRLLVDVAASFVGWAGDGHADVKMTEVASHLDETWFSWYGGFDDVAPFYYRLHSPVVLIEFDHHPGTVFQIPTPTRHHVHMVVRTPNGGDYGADLLAQHHERFDHTRGSHRERGGPDRSEHGER
jgi:fructose-1,6-bisphosphatase/inositol monophosphatase family enzyme